MKILGIATSPTVLGAAGSTQAKYVGNFPLNYVYFLQVLHSPALEEQRLLVAQYKLRLTSLKTQLAGAQADAGRLRGECEDLRKQLARAESYKATAERQSALVKGLREEKDRESALRTSEAEESSKVIG